MASVGFQIHTDKENHVSAGIKTVAGGHQGVKAKSFQAHKTPRRALGSVNEANRVGLGSWNQSAPQNLKAGISSQPAALKPKNINAGPVQKDGKFKVQQPDKENVQRAKQQKQEEKENVVCGLKARQTQPSNPLDFCLPEREYMPPSPPRDDSEDVLPEKKRPSTYVHRLLSWRPACLFSTLPDSDNEEEQQRERQSIIDQLDSLPMAADRDILPPANLALSLEALDMDMGDVPLPSIDDVPHPCLEDMAETSAQDVTLPFMDEDNEAHSSGVAMSPSQLLDDSLRLSPHLGSLDMLDTSLPSGGQ